MDRKIKILYKITKMKLVFEAEELHTWFYEMAMLMISYRKLLSLIIIQFVFLWFGLSLNPEFQVEHLAS